MAEASIRSVVATGFATYRRRFGSICIAAVLVFAPLDLLAVVGPVIVIEDLGVWSANRRSAGLTGRHLLPVVVTALVCTTTCGWGCRQMSGPPSSSAEWSGCSS
jgi:hypothetical protein